jgi:hypothetical protein
MAIMPYLQRHRFADLIADLDGMDCWLRELGLEAKQDRAHFAIDILREADRGFQEFRATGQPCRIGNVNNYIFGICEGLEIHDIFQAFRQEPRERIAPALERTLSGPHRPAQENEGNADGRNVGFELALGAELRLLGATIELGEPDLQLVCEGNRYLLACKRPARREGIETCLRAARRQLEANLDGHDQPTFGVAVISVGRILNPGTLYFAAENERLGDRVQGLLEENMRHCVEVVRRHPAICGVLFHAATPADQGDGLLLRMSYSVLYDGGRPSAAFQQLGNYLRPIYGIA